jgi:FkbM family methyltransferase
MSPESRQRREFDRLTIEIAKKILKKDSNYVDAGAHRGEILKTLVKLAPQGRGFAFEPLIDLSEQLKRKYSNVEVHQVALGDEESIATFYSLKDDSANSSLFRRPEREEGHWLEETRVQLRRLDDCIPTDCPIAFLKVDVEGAEINLFAGAKQLLIRDRPTVVFECPSRNVGNIVDLLSPLGFDVTFLEKFVAGETEQPRDLVERAQREGVYYFVASNRR